MRMKPTASSARCSKAGRSNACRPSIACSCAWVRSNCASIPKRRLPVAINEAVELAKRFSTEDSGKFVNGVLNAVAHAKA